MEFPDVSGVTGFDGRVEGHSHRPAEELYGLKNDPDEMKDLAADPEPATTKAALQRRLDAWMKEQGDTAMSVELKRPSRAGHSNKGN